jgi:dTDP-4-amino-4,6-dideoxygalactose transaminase
LPYKKKSNILNNEDHVWHVFAVRVKNREHFQNYLSGNDIQTVIHYPIPPHKQQAYSEWINDSYPISEKIHEEIISLPVSPVMSDNDYRKVAEIVNAYKD